MPFIIYCQLSSQSLSNQTYWEPNSKVEKESKVFERSRFFFLNLNYYSPVVIEQGLSFVDRRSTLLHNMLGC